MLRISVRSRQGSPVDGLNACFGEDGGTIGRASTNKLVLDDPDRTVSRVHAQIAHKDGTWVIVDRGSNPTQLNGQPIGAGNEAAIRPGDRLQVGSYLLQVSAATDDAAAEEAGDVPAASAPESLDASDDDPFAHLLDGLGEPAPAPVTPSPAAPDPTAGLFPDPLGIAPAAVSGSDPFADLSSPRDAPAPASDDFSDLTGSRGGGAESIDALFGLGEPVGHDPLADPLLQPNTASGQDPLAALSRQAAPTPAARSDHVPVDAFGFVPPSVHTRQSPAPAVPAAPDADDPLAGIDLGMPAPSSLPPASDGPPVDADAKSAEPAATGAPVDPFAGLARKLSVPTAPPESSGVPAPAGDDPFAGLGSGEPVAPADAHRVPAPSASPADADRAIVAPQAPSPAAAQKSRASRSAVAAPVAPNDSIPVKGAVARAASDDELLAAFLRGVGSLQKPLDTLTPELMQRMGEMLRTATEGTLQLLHTRQEFKQEVRAQVTMIAAQANNPLKFSPTVEVALSHLLGERVRGFMAAEDAMRDAYQDLRAHEFGVMVGMRAALDHVIKQFEPEALEENIATRSRLDAIFSANRKARLWDQFVKLYIEIAREAEDDFHSLFGKAFLRAYEEQMQRLKAADEGTSDAD